MIKSPLETVRRGLRWDVNVLADDFDLEERRVDDGGEMVDGLVVCQITSPADVGLEDFRRCC